MLHSFIWLIAAAITCLSIAVALERRERRKQKRNAEVLAQQPDEPYNPQATFPLDDIMQSHRAWLVEDEKFCKLGDLFQKLRYFERYGITFDRYMRMVENGTWINLAG